MQLRPGRPSSRPRRPGAPRLVYFHARNSGRSRRVEGVVEGKRIRGRLAGPRGCRDIERLLAPWLR